jgi:hypothetical protein
MAAYSELQEEEFAAEADGYTATKHQREVGTGYFDDVARVIAAAKPRPRRSRVRLRKSNSDEMTKSFELRHFLHVHAALTDSRLAALCAEERAKRSKSTKRVSTRSRVGRAIDSWRATGAAATRTPPSDSDFTRLCSMT